MKEKWFIRMKPWIGNMKYGILVMGVRRPHEAYVPAKEAPYYVKEWLELKEEKYCSALRSTQELFDVANENESILRITRRGAWYTLTVLIKPPETPAPLKPRICKVDFDTAVSVSAKDEEGNWDYHFYYDAKLLEGSGWYATVCQDFPSITWDIIVDEGPFDHEQDALDWCKDLSLDLFYSHDLMPEEA